MRHYLWNLRPYFRQTSGALLLGSLAGIAMNTAVVLPPLLLGRAIDTALALQHGRASASAMGWSALLYLLGTLATEGPRVLKRWWLMTANARIRASIRSDLVRGMLATPLATLHQTPIGDLLARAIGDVEVLGVGVREFVIETWDTVLFSLSLIVAMFALDPGLAALAMAPTIPAFAISYVGGRQVAGRTRTARETNAALTAAIQEQLTGVRMLRLFGRADAMVAQADAQAAQLAAANVSTIRVRAGVQPLYHLLLTAGVVPLIALGGARVIAGGLTIGAFVAFLQLYARYIGRGFRIPQLVNSVQSGGVAYARLRPWLAPAPVRTGRAPRFASLRAGHLPGEPSSAPPVTNVAGGPIGVSLRDVTFRYPEAPASALCRLSLEIPAGAFVAVTGPVGCGKSALAQTLLGLLPREAGSVMLDGVLLEQLAEHVRAARIGYVPQEPLLFSGSIASNVLLAADDRLDAEACGRIAGAIDRAALTEDIRGFPDGLATVVGELGIRVSGGQRQRIAVARALTAPRQPGLLILDDPFAAVDVATEAQLIAALRDTFGPAADATQRATVVLLSHRLAAFPLADQVVVLDAGRVVEQGSHAALLGAGGVYARIFQAQQRAAEAAP
jgi:ABC-type multidrug transport system fused ATPase/permease subunit